MQKKIAQSRLEELAAYFNDEDTKLKQKIDQLLDVLRSIYCDIQSIQPIDKMNLYEEYRSFYEEVKFCFNSEKLLLLSQLETVEKKITEKKAHTNDNQTADDPCKRFGGKLGVIKNVGISKRLPAGIYGNGYRRSLDVYFECWQRS